LGGCGWCGVGELGEAGLGETGANMGSEHGVVEPGVGNSVAVAVRDPCDQAVRAEPAQVVADLASADLVGVSAH
jgi:hypothetical protein